MAKRLMILAGMLAVLLAAAVPAFAQGPVTATGMLVGPVDDGDQDPTPEYRLTDEASGASYVLVSGFVNLQDYAGERVTITGVPIGGADDAPPALNVTQVDPADGPPGPPPGEEFATLTFELAVEGTPPADATFFGNVQFGEGGPGAFVPLEDADGDGLYTGATTATRFGPGPRPVPPGVEPLSFGVRIVQGTGTQGSLPGQPITVIKDFGPVQMNDQTLSASVSFEDGDVPPGPSPGENATFSFELTVECEPPADAEFLGFTASESLVTTPLTDPDGDGAYTGSITQPKFAPGPRPAPPNIEPVSLPVRIVQGPPTGATALGPEFRVIKDFGLVKAEDETFTASVSFCDDGDNDGSGNGGSDNGDSGGSGNSGGSSGSGSDDGGPGGSGSGGSGSGGGSETGSESPGGAGGITGLLPSTGGGVALTVLGAGILLVAGGLLVRRLSR